MIEPVSEHNYPAKFEKCGRTRNRGASVDILRKGVLRCAKDRDRPQAATMTGYKGR